MASTRRARSIAAIIATGALLAVPPVAAAEVYCVDVSGGDCTSLQPNFQTALDQAELNVGPDTVRLGSTTYTAPPLAGFNYVGGNGSVSIIGQGQGSTVLTVPAQPDVFDIHPVLVLGAGGGGSSVSDLAITLPTPTPPNANVPQYRGINASVPITVSNVTINGSSSPTNGFGMILAGATIQDMTINLHVGAGFPKILGISTSGTTSIEDSTVAADTAVRSGASGDLTVRRSALRSSIVEDAGALDLISGTAVIENSTIDIGSFADAVGISVGNPNTGGGDTATLTADHVTIANGGSDSSGLRISANDDSATDSFTATLTNVAISGPTTPIRRIADNGDTANVTAAYSNYNPAANVSSNGASGVGAINETNVTNHAPGFVDAPSGDLHLLSTSPLIDIGDPVAPPAGVFDIDGDPRALDGIFDCSGTPRRDIGADEFRPLQPVGVKDCLAPDTSVTGRRKVRTRKKRARISFTIGSTEPGALECSLDGAPFAPCASTFSARVRRGTHTLLAAAIDIAGNVDPTPASFTTRVKRKRLRRSRSPS